MDRTELLNELKGKPIVNSHSHHLRDEEQHVLGLEGVLRNSYVNSCGAPFPAIDSREAVSRWLDTVRCRSYFLWLEKALMELYGIGEPLSADNWEIFDKAIREAHQDKEWHLRILREKCGYQAVLLDTFWSPGEDNGHPELFKPAYRINSMFFGFNQEAADHNGNNIQADNGRHITDIDEYTAFCEEIIQGRKQAGCPVLKCALAYDRSLNFGVATKEQAQKAMRASASAEDIRHFQDYLFDQICRIAAALSMPVQIHTGLGLMKGSNAMCLQPAIERNPDTTFLLMHGSYPWTADIAGLTHSYTNVWADLCWLPIISPTAARRLMHELIDVCDADRVVWGCDTWTSEESYGARLAFLDTLTHVLTERMEDGLMQESDARRYAKAVMYDNAAEILFK